MLDFWLGEQFLIGRIQQTHGATTASSLERVGRTTTKKKQNYKSTKMGWGGEKGTATLSPIREQEKSKKRAGYIGF